MIEKGVKYVYQKIETWGKSKIYSYMWSKWVFWMEGIFLCLDIMGTSHLSYCVIATRDHFELADG